LPEIGTGQLQVSVACGENSEYCDNNKVLFHPCGFFGYNRIMTFTQHPDPAHKSLGSLSRQITYATATFKISTISRGPEVV